MKKNAIHNFNISIQNSADIESSEQLTQTMLKELAKVSKEIHQQKDIEQLWQEQKDQNAVLNLSISSTEEGAKDTKSAMFEKTAMSESNTSSVSRKNIFGDIWSSSDTSISNAPNGGSADDNTGRVNMTSDASEGNTPPFSRAGEILQNLSSTGQIYGLDGQQSLLVPRIFQTNSNDPSIEVVKAEIKKKLDFAKANKTGEVDYWERISKAFDNGARAADFDGKPEEILFTEMYAALKQSMLSSVEIRNFNWEDVRVKMLKAIDEKILKGPISENNRNRWKAIRAQLADDKVDIANLFQHDELFLLLKEVEGLEKLPGIISITTKTKVYPNLSPSRMYAPIGKESVYAFLKKIDEIDDNGRSVNKGAVKIKNTEASSFIVGESLEFYLDEKLITESSKKKEDINWVVYKDAKKLGADFINEGTSFSYNFDAPGAYIVEAFGASPGANKKKTSSNSAFVKFDVVAEQIMITSSDVNKEGFTRASAKEKSFKVALKNSKVKTLNPLKLYYQIETAINDKAAVVSEERELDATGIIKLIMPDFGTYKIKVSSKDQYGLVTEFKASVTKNEVTSIGYLSGSSNRNVFLTGNSGSSLTLEPKTYKLNPATEKEKQDVKWMIYDSNNKPYIQSGESITNENDDPKRPFLLKWESFLVPIPQKEGHYTVEAYYDIKKGPKDGAVFKMEVKKPEIAQAYWASKAGSKKIDSGFLGESNWIKANIPYYENQLVRVYFYLNNKKTNHYCDVKTNDNGDILQEVKFDSNFKKLIGFPNNGTAKVGFKLLGIQNGKPYKFNSPANYESDTVISTTTDKKVVDIYFRYDGKRLRSEDQVPFGKEGAMVAIAATTQNMVGDEVTLKVHKVGEDPIYISKVRVNSEGVAAASFLMRNFDKKLKLGEIVKYYAGVEEYSTKHLDDKVLVMIVGDGKITENKYGIDVEYFLSRYNDENKENLKVLLNDMNEYFTTEKITPQREQVAYMLATVYTETFKTFKPIIESFWIKNKTKREKTYYRYDPILANTEKRRETAISRGNTEKGDGVKYCGRGYVQLTWKNNYKKIRDKFGVDVVNYPDKVLEPKLAVKIMIWGMNNGIFTGVGVNRYINNSKVDYVSARKVINGKDRNVSIANDAKKFEKNIKIIETLEVSVPKTLMKALDEMKIIADKHLPYAMEGNTGASDGLRTSLSDNALSKMDCSEFVCRYLHKLGITKEVKWVTTSSMVSQSSFQKSLGTDRITFVGNSQDFKPQAGDIFVWSRSANDGHTGIVYKYDSANDLVTILEAIGKTGSADETTNEKNGGYTKPNCTRTSIYKAKGKALFAHAGFKGYFRPQKHKI